MLIDAAARSRRRSNVHLEGQQMMASPHQAPTADDAAASVDLANRREHDDCKAAEATEIEAPAAVRYIHVSIAATPHPPRGSSPGFSLRAPPQGDWTTNPLMNERKPESKFDSSKAVSKVGGANWFGALSGAEGGAGGDGGKACGEASDGSDSPPYTPSGTPLSPKNRAKKPSLDSPRCGPGRLCQPHLLSIFIAFLAAVGMGGGGAAALNIGNNFLSTGRDVESRPTMAACYASCEHYEPTPPWAEKKKGCLTPGCARATSDPAEQGRDEGLSCDDLYFVSGSTGRVRPCMEDTRKAFVPGMTTYLPWQWRQCGGTLVLETDPNAANARPTMAR
ncbi:hypothetical protein EMIHUDRAFT_454115 [Emiliania huxleyi CCMP1516]|uniref:Uncharacterized protein n=2 Tax=Emiliania huxleyi TaxID=2903 RepID=A0A0D3KYP1_EMIH1|nr:hypothetical protein EMIHUDRAFT_454115 [Emiliania huxleyi CCMP1516]EOD40876.1 hypothetical protein EMIHUDRAFT_454115 [Emiliania huxleyi CCMP1516]|eukprot:XP_005793305.1 hypothetical protein EMIHUDRAFT_454115 [Emiliania huxleyi CCMP1516]